MNEPMVGIPAYNEEDTIASVVFKALDHVDEVVVIDDGSTDCTARLAEKAGAHVIEHEINMGKGAAMNTLFEYARQKKVRALVTVDGDGQHPEHEITHLLSKVLDGKADIAIGSRFLEKKHTKKMPFYRRIGNKLLSVLTPTGKAKNHSNGKKGNVTDTQSGFRAYSRKAVRRIKPKESGIGVDSEILMIARKHRMNILEVPSTVSYEGKTSHQGPIGHTLDVISSIIRYIETKHSLLTFGVGGLIVFISGVVVAIRAMNMFQNSGMFPTGTAIIALLLLLVGLGSGMTGLILHAIMNAHRRGYE